MDFWLSTTPSSAFAFPTGQAISRTTYATLFAAMGTAYGSGDGSTTFNLPDKTGRASVMKEASASRLTSTYFGGDSTALGSTGGGESKSLITANLPAYTPAGSITNGAITNTVSGGTVGGSASNTVAGAAGGTVPTPAATIVVSSSQAASTFTGTAQGGTSAAFRTVQPTIVCNYILRII
jgi:microcystin-dependent protein